MAKPIQDSVKVNFSGGLDLKSDPKQIDASEFLALNNMVFTTGGRLTKRNGFAGGYTKTVNTPNPVITSSAIPATLTEARKVFSYNNELLLNDAWNLYSWDAASSSWNYKGRSTCVGLTTESIVSGVNTYLEADVSVDTTTNIKVFAYYSSAGVYYSIQDVATGQFIINRALLGANYTNPRCLSISGKSWIFAVNTTDGKLYYQAIVGQTVTGSPTALITNLHVGEYIFTVTNGTASVGAIYTNNGQTFTVVTAVTAGITLVTTGTGAPAVSGTLTKSAGTGDATIAFSSVAVIQQMYDVDVDVFSGNIYIAWFTTTPSISIAILSTSLVIGNTITKAESATNGVSWFGDGSNIWVCYNNGSATKAFIVNNAVSATTAPPAVIDNSALASAVNNVTGVWSTLFNKAFIFYDKLDSSFSFTNSAQINYNTATIVAGSISPGTAVSLIGSLNINSKAFTVSGIPHLVGLYTYNTNRVSLGIAVVQATNFLINLYNITPTMGGGANNDVIGNIAAKISQDGAALLAPAQGRNTGVHQTSTNVWELATLQNSNFGLESQPYSPFFSPTGVIDCKFDFSISNPAVQSLGNNAQRAGGAVIMYDGANVVEQNFHIYPNAFLGVEADTGGNMGLGSADSLYGYIYTYEWIDNQGQVHRSFPSPNTTAFTSGQEYTFASGVTAGQVTLSVPMLRVTNKPGTQVVVNIYRTVANGSVYFLVGSYGTLINDPSKDFTTYVDTAADSFISANIQLYTTGALGYYAPPATSDLTNFKNRALAVASEDPYQLGYSNQTLPNFPVQFVPNFLQNIGTVGGALITVAQMDDKMILFKNGKIAGPSIYYMVGQGPAPSGANNDFQDPLPIAVSVGCVDRPSVVLTDAGLLFKSDKGIFLLSRGLEAEYIGAPVEAYNQYSVLSAVLIPNSTQVRFWLSNGTLLMYDYFYKKWATWTPPAGISDCIFQGQHTYVSSTGQVYQETPGLFIDGTATPVLWNFTTAWIKLAGLQGYQRAFWFLLLGDYISSHQLSVSMYTNFSATPDETVTITPISSKSLENWRVFFKNQRCQSFQISIQEVSTGTLGQGLNLSGLNLIAGFKSKYRTISAAESTG